MSGLTPTDTPPGADQTAPSRDIRLHLDADLRAGAEIDAPTAAAHYLVHVMRVRQGDTLRLFNSRDGEWVAEIAAAGKREARLRAIRRTRPPAAPPDLLLLFAPIKKARTDFIVEKATELGCRGIWPVMTRRTNAERVKTDRLRAHMIEAAEQCGLVFVPELAEPARLLDALATWPAGRRLFFCDETTADGGSAAPPLARAAAAAGAGPAAILIGPEGGFDAQEAAALRAAPFVTPVTLGPRVLRADTAAAAAIAVWQSAVGDWG